MDKCSSREVMTWQDGGGQPAQLPPSAASAGMVADQLRLTAGVLAQDRTLDNKLPSAWAHFCVCTAQHSTPPLLSHLLRLIPRAIALLPWPGVCQHVQVETLHDRFGKLD